MPGFLRILVHMWAVIGVICDGSFTIFDEYNRPTSMPHPGGYIKFFNCSKANYVDTSGSQQAIMESILALLTPDVLLTVQDSRIFCDLSRTQFVEIPSQLISRFTAIYTNTCPSSVVSCGTNQMGNNAVKACNNDEEIAPSECSAYKEYLKNNSIQVTHLVNASQPCVAFDGLLYETKHGASRRLHVGSIIAIGNDIHASDEDGLLFKTVNPSVMMSCSIYSISPSALKPKFMNGTGRVIVQLDTRSRDRHKIECHFFQPLQAPFPFAFIYVLVVSKRLHVGCSINEHNDPEYFCRLHHHAWHEYHQYNYLTRAYFSEVQADQSRMMQCALHLKQCLPHINDPFVLTDQTVCTKSKSHAPLEATPTSTVDEEFDVEMYILWIVFGFQCCLLIVIANVVLFCVNKRGSTFVGQKSKTAGSPVRDQSHSPSQDFEIEFSPDLVRINQDASSGNATTEMSETNTLFGIPSMKNMSIKHPSDDARSRSKSFQDATAATPSKLMSQSRRGTTSRSAMSGMQTEEMGSASCHTVQYDARPTPRAVVDSSDTMESESN